jgi:hypothetical protein
MMRYEQDFYRDVNILVKSFINVEKELKIKNEITVAKEAYLLNLITEEQYKQIIQKYIKI